MPLAGVTGHALAGAATANLIYDLPVAKANWPVQPYLGAGIGMTRLSLGDVSSQGLATFHPANLNTFTGPDTVTFGNGNALAYELIAGVSKPFSFKPGLELFAEYRFLGSSAANVFIYRVANGNDLVNGANCRFCVARQLATVGLRYQLPNP